MNSPAFNHSLKAALSWDYCRHHIHQAKAAHVQGHKWALVGHATLGVLQGIPLLGQLISIIECAAVRIFHALSIKISPTPKISPTSSDPRPSLRRVSLLESSPRTDLPSSSVSVLHSEVFKPDPSPSSSALQNEVFKSNPPPIVWVSEPQGRSQFSLGWATSACTPFAVAFAAGAHLQGKGASEGGDLAQELSDLLNYLAKRHDTLNLVEGFNYTASEAIDLINSKLDLPSLQLEESWSFCRDNPGIRTFPEEGEAKWGITWKDLIRQMPDGQGALFQFAGYSLGLRRCGRFWEVFDSHNGSAYAEHFKSLPVGQGAYIVRCLGADQAISALQKLVNTGPGGVLTGSDNSNDRSLQNEAAQMIEVSLLR